MKPEQNDQLEHRAAVHAALADPVRLRIVDLLALGDLSSTELQSVLGVPSNLLAHHLRVLEDQRMIVRSRSEGDRRRGYIRLRRESLDDLALTVHTSARRVVFVCTGNSARSPLAAAIWERSSPIPSTSAGTHPAESIARGAVKAAGRHGLDLSSARPQSLTPLLGDSDLIVTVCDRAHEELRRADAIHWSVPDPVLIGTARAFDAAYDELAERIAELVPRLTAA